MGERVSYCGLNCAECKAYIATIRNDQKMREEVAQSWSEMYQAEISASQINCRGCTDPEGPYFSHCYECEIRKCSKEHEVINCAYCDEYHCEKIENFFTMVPEAKNRLDTLRRGFED